MRITFTCNVCDQCPHAYSAGIVFIQMSQAGKEVEGEGSPEALMEGDEMGIEFPDRVEADGGVGDADPNGKEPIDVHKSQSVDNVANSFGAQRVFVALPEQELVVHQLHPGGVSAPVTLVEGFPTEADVGMVSPELEKEFATVTTGIEENEECDQRLDGVSVGVKIVAQTPARVDELEKRVEYEGQR